MKKICKFIKSNFKVVIAFILGIIISGTGVYAATIIYNSNQVGYDNTNTNLTLNDQSVDNVQDAIDALYTKTTGLQTQLNTCTGNLSTCQSNLANAPIAKNNRVYYAYGTPTTSSTTDYTTLNKTVFVALNGSQKSVCIIRNSKLHCFDNNNYPIEKDHVQQVFSDISCDVSSSALVRCDASDFNCSVGAKGLVLCNDYSDDYLLCEVDSRGSVDCH